MKLNTERIHTIWHLTWPQCIMLLCQFVIGITDVWAGGRIGSLLVPEPWLEPALAELAATCTMASPIGAPVSSTRSEKVQPPSALIWRMTF